MSATEMLQRLNFYNCCPSGIIAANEDIFNGDPASDVINMAKYDEIIFIIVKNAGATGTATLTVESCDDLVPTTTTAIVFDYKVCTSGNTWGALTRAAATGLVTTAGANQCYVISVKADLLSGSNQYVRLVATELVNNPVDGAILCVGVKEAYSQDVPESMIV